MYNVESLNVPARWKRDSNSPANGLIPVTLRLTSGVATHVLGLIQSRNSVQSAKKIPAKLERVLNRLLRHSPHMDGKTPDLVYLDNFAITTLTYAETHDYSWAPIVVFVREEGLDMVSQLVGHATWIQVVDVGNAINYEFGSEMIFPETQSDSQYNAGDVIVAVIDNGIGFANSRFREKENTSRFHAFWGMNAAAGGDKSVNFGRQWSKAEITQAIYENTDDEDIYLQLGAVSSDSDRDSALLRRVSHGTHVLDIASGFDSHSGVPSKRPLLGVDLPIHVVADTSGSSTIPFITLALEWILQQAIHMKSEDNWLPLVVNWSFGVTSGPCDGDSSVEVILQDFLDRYRSISQRQCEVVLPAGNHYLEQTHKTTTLSPREETVLEWNIQPDDKTDSFVTIVPRPATSETTQVPYEHKLEVKIRAPNTDATSIETISSFGTEVDLVVADSVVGRVYHYLDAREWVGTPGEVITVAVKPTESDSQYPNAPHGVWEIGVRNVASTNVKITARIQRDDSLPGIRHSGRQSRFLDNSPDGSFNAYASNLDVLAVGGYIESTGLPAPYSGAGPLLSGRIGPDLSAVSEMSQISKGVKASGTVSGTVVSMGGTSVAAPRVARALADLFANKKTKKDLYNFQSTTSGARGEYLPLVQERHGKIRL